MSIILDGMSWVLLLSGAFFGLTGAYGLFRFPDFFTRVHAASVTDTMACLLIIGGLILQAGFTLVAVKLVFILLFLLVTSPTASHALAKAARHGGMLTILERPLNKSKEPN